MPGKSGEFRAITNGHASSATGRDVFRREAVSTNPLSTKKKTTAGWPWNRIFSTSIVAEGIAFNMTDSPPICAGD